MIIIFFFQTQIQARAKTNAVKQENDKQDELRRAALRVVVALQVSILFSFNLMNFFYFKIFWRILCTFVTNGYQTLKFWQFNCKVEEVFIY